MTKPIDISVVIPAYNYANYLDECLASVFMQKNINMEIIVVDDGSTDNTRRVAEKYGNRIQYIYQTNSGLSCARNTGAKNSKGRFVQFLDADDLLGPGNLDAKLSTIASDSKDKTLSVCRNWKFSHSTGVFDLYYIRNWYLYNNDLNYHLCRINIAPPHAYMIPKSLFDEIGYFDESMKGCEDYDFWLRAIGKGYSLKRCNRSFVYYRQHGRSMGAGKYRKGDLAFDVLVHKKKENGQYGHGIRDLINQPQGKVAFIDGLLLTALYINPEINHQGILDLTDIACRHLQDLNKIIINGGSLDSIICRLYISRIFNKAHRTAGLGNNQMQDLILELYQLVKGKSYIRKTLKQAFPYTSYDKLATAYHALKFMASGNIDIDQ